MCQKLKKSWNLTRILLDFAKFKKSSFKSRFNIRWYNTTQQINNNVLLRPRRCKLHPCVCLSTMCSTLLYTYCTSKIVDQQFLMILIPSQIFSWVSHWCGWLRRCQNLTPGNSVKQRSKNLKSSFINQTSALTNSFQSTKKIWPRSCRFMLKSTTGYRFPEGKLQP